MKKILLLLVIIINLGCSNNEDNQSSTNEMEYDIEITIIDNGREYKYVDVYSYNNYEVGVFSFDTPKITKYNNEYSLSAFLYGLSNNGILSGDISDLSLHLGENIETGQIININSYDPSMQSNPISIEANGVLGVYYFFNESNSNGQIKILSNQNNKLAGEFTFNNLSRIASNGQEYYIKVIGKFRNMPIIN